MKCVLCLDRLRCSSCEPSRHSSDVSHPHHDSATVPRPRRKAKWHAHHCFATLAFYDCAAGREGAAAGAGASLANQEEADLAAALFRGGRHCKERQNTLERVM